MLSVGGMSLIQHEEIAKSFYKAIQCSYFNSMAVATMKLAVTINVLNNQVLHCEHH